MSLFNITTIFHLSLPQVVHIYIHSLNIYLLPQPDSPPNAQIPHLKPPFSDHFFLSTLPFSPRFPVHLFWNRIPVVITSNRKQLRWLPSYATVYVLRTPQWDNVLEIKEYQDNGIGKTFTFPVWQVKLLPRFHHQHAASGNRNHLYYRSSFLFLSHYIMRTVATTGTAVSNILSLLVYNGALLGTACGGGIVLPLATRA